MSIDKSLRRWDVPEISTHTMVLRHSRKQICSDEYKSECSKYKCLKGHYSVESRSFQKSSADHFSHQKSYALQLEKNASYTIGNLKQYLKTSSLEGSYLSQPKFQVKLVNGKAISSSVDETHANNHEYVNKFNVDEYALSINHLPHTDRKLKCNSSDVLLTSHYTTYSNTMPRRSSDRGRVRRTVNKINISSSDEGDVQHSSPENAARQSTSNYFFRHTRARNRANSSVETNLSSRTLVTDVINSEIGVRNSNVSALRLSDQDFRCINEEVNGSIDGSSCEAEESLLYGLLNVEANHISGLSRYVTLLKKSLYFCLLKPMHLDVEFLSRANGIGKKKILFFILLPLLVWLLFGGFRSGRLQLFKPKKETSVVVGTAGSMNILDEFRSINADFNSTSDLITRLHQQLYSEHVSQYRDQPSLSRSMSEHEVKSLVEKLIADLNFSQPRAEEWENLIGFKNGMSREFIAAKKEIEQLKIRLNVAETTAKVLSDFVNDFKSFKDCCQNDSVLLTFVESHIASMFKALMGEDGNTTYRPFRDWLFANFGSEKFALQLKTAISEMENNNKLYKESLMQSIKKDMEGLHTGFPDNVVEGNVELIFKKMMQKYDADKTGQADYALESGGGSIVSTRCSETFSERNPRITILGFPLWYGSNSPRNAIQPNIYPGQCWAFKGTNGYLVIQLAASIKPTGFVIEHIPKSISPTGNIDSAPKDFSVYGLETEKDAEGKLLGKYSYDKDGDSLQYFPVQAKNPSPYNFVELKVHSNHGDMNYTCLYRFRVHGLRP